MMAILEVVGRTGVLCAKTVRSGESSLGRFASERPGDLTCTAAFAEGVG